MSIIKSLFNYICRWLKHFWAGNSLKAKRQRYFFAKVATLPDLNVQSGSPYIPFDENPSLEWIKKVLKVLVGKILVNHVLNRKVQGLTAAAYESESTKLDKFTNEKFADPLKAYKQLHLVVSQVTKEKAKEHITSKWSTTLADYNNMFHSGGVPLPDIHTYFQPKAGNEGWFEDSFFANLRTAGFNPMVIQGVSAIPKAFIEMTEAQYTAAVGAGFESDTLSSAAAEGRLFHCDYSMLKELIENSETNAGGKFPKGNQKYLYTAQALFALPPTASYDQPASLQPVAIRLRSDGPLFYPHDPKDTHSGIAWTQAKYAVNSADGNHHELFSHLGWTHLVIEPFAVCTQRNLGESHPLFKLLVPHFEGTIFINNLAASELIAPEGQVTEILASTATAAESMTVKARAINASGYFKFNQQFVKKELAARKVMDKKLSFTYRDDALRVSDAIQELASDYVDIYYKSEEEVKTDGQLQTWASARITKDKQGGQIQDFGDSISPDRVISSKDYLKDALSLIIFISSAQHAAVNFAQAYIMLYVPAFPGGLYTQAPNTIPSKVDTYSQNGTDPGLLTPDGVTKVQLDLLTLLGGVYYTQLGQYDSGQFKDKQVNDALDRFQRNLVGIGVQIRQDNKTRPLKYPYFLPDKIPQSINI